MMQNTLIKNKNNYIAELGMIEEGKNSSDQIYFDQEQVGQDSNLNKIQESLEYEIQSDEQPKVSDQEKMKLKFRKYQPWTDEEDKILMQLYDQYPKQWKKISEKMKNRSNAACFLRFKSKLKKSNEKKGWTTQQDQMLLQLYQKNPENWKIIAKFFPRRNRMTCYNRYRLLKNLTVPQISRDWTKQQDTFLIDLYAKFPQQWDKIASHFQNCNSTNCYIRYKKLKNLRQTKLWTIQEDNLLLQLTQKYNSNWKKIHSAFKKTRSMNAIKLRYYTIRTLLNKRIKWPSQQKRKLEKLVKQYEGDWYQIHKYFPNSSFSDCILEYYSGKTIGGEIKTRRKSKQSRVIVIEDEDPTKKTRLKSQKQQKKFYQSQSEYRQSDEEYSQSAIASNLYNDSVSNELIELSEQSGQILIVEKPQIPYLSEQGSEKFWSTIKMLKQQMTKQCLELLNTVIQIGKNYDIEILSLI